MGKAKAERAIIPETPLPRIDPIAATLVAHKKMELHPQDRRQEEVKSTITYTSRSSLMLSKTNFSA